MVEIEKKQETTPKNPLWPLLATPQTMDKCERNYRLFKKLLDEGYYVLPFLTKWSTKEDRFIDYMIVATAKPENEELPYLSLNSLQSQG